jgi:hypothetical protein
MPRRGAWKEGSRRGRRRSAASTATPHSIRAADCGSGTGALNCALTAKGSPV